MQTQYRIDDWEELFSPGLVVFREIVLDNLQRMLAIAGSSERLRPHCKTHKMPDLIALELDLGIRKHKCATFAEAEMLALAGVEDIFMAYNLVGPNIPRAVSFKKCFPGVDFAVTADHPQAVAALNSAMVAASETIGVLLDLDPGLNRTGVASMQEAIALYSQIRAAPGLVARGLHFYDGHNHQPDPEDRRRAVEHCWAVVPTLRDALIAQGLPVKTIVAGGTGSFPILAAQSEPGLELSPGTTVFHDAGYAEIFPDLDFTPAALLLTRVVSKPAPNRLTFDLGSKACASDPPAGNRLRFPDIPDAREILQNEEHLVLETDHAERFAPGDATLAIPRHICPTSALYSHAAVVTGSRVNGVWPVTARDRRLSI